MKLLSILLLLSSQLVFGSNDFYSLKFKSISGKEMSMAQYKGKPLVIVNTASKCGYTGQLDDLQKVYQKYKDKGLTVIGFPSNSFRQELSSNGDVAKFCKMNYGVKFPMASIVSVKGTDQHPVFKYLTTKGGDVSGTSKSSSYLNQEA